MVYKKISKNKKQLKQKELLLTETHHRVKNNLALTIGFIELQETKIEDKNTKKILLDVKDRIYTINLLHKKLCQSQSLNKIPLREYIQDLVEYISKTYNTKDIQTNIKVDEIYLNIEKAMPLGLVLNELITNSFKYGFNQDGKLILDISLFCDKEDCQLIVKDNGKGLENGLSQEIDTKHMGLRLVSTIVKMQLFGSIDYEYENGAKFIIKSKLKDSIF